MKWLFVDDSQQPSPTRPGMRPLVAVGGLLVDDSAIKPLSTQIDALCASIGFPAAPAQDSEFKWSPGRELWMRSNLVGPSRQDFFKRVIDLVAANEGSAIVVVLDTAASPPIPGRTSEMNCLLLLLERFHASLSLQERGVVVADTPPGNRGSEQGFLAECVEVLGAGTNYSQFDRLILPVLSAPSHVFRLLQVADLITSCILAYIAGESTYAPVTAPEIIRILRRDSDRVGGYGIKIHPDLRYANLYHWLFGDSHFWRGSSGNLMPLLRMRYASGPSVP